MAEQVGITPVAKAGILPNNDWSDYPTPQDFHNASAAYLEISTEAGATGEKGDTGDDAPAITYTIAREATIAIPVGVDELNTGIDLEGKIVQIRAPIGHSTIQEENFAVGVIEDQTVFFVFTKNSGDVPVVARAGWTLEIYRLEQS